MIRPSSAREARRFDERCVIAAILLLALVVRLPCFTAGSLHGVDLDILVRWVRRIQTHGLVTIYDGTGVNYPPLSLYLLAAEGWIESLLPESMRPGDGALSVLIKLPATVADLLTAWMIWLALHRQTPVRRVLACALYAFNPAIWYVAAYWAQLDAIYSLFLIVSIVSLAQRRVVPAWLAYTVALAVKLQSISLAPLLAVATARAHGARAVAAGLTFSVMAGALIASPWLLTGQIGSLVRACTTVVPRIDESAYNFWYLVRLGDIHQISSALQPLGLPLSYKAVGIALYGVCALLVSALVWRQGGTALALPAAALSMGLFMFLTEIHERFMFPAVAFVLLAAADGDDYAGSGRKLWCAYALLSVTFLFNLMTVASFAPALWTNLVAIQPPYPSVIAILKGLALVSAATNTFIFGLLMVELARGSSSPVPAP